ncbi:MAG: PD-(D/E)XK nuclease family protein, partial [Mycobacteriales bacterium]
VPAAAPEAWWGMAPATPGAEPIRPPDAPVRVSASGLAAFDLCPLRWFFEREAAAVAASSAAQGFGSVLHALARLVSTGALPDDVDLLVERLDTVWGALGFEAAWLGPRERERARAALHRLVRWNRDNDREHLGSEVGFGPVEAAGALLAGTVDRLDADAEGKLHIVDYKTSAKKPAKAKVAVDLQLGLYQLAAQAGAMTEVAGGRDHVGGAELVQLVDGLADGGPSVQPQDPLPSDGEPVTSSLHAMVDAVLGEQFPARPNDRCERCAFRRACPAQDAGQGVVA